MMDNDGLRWYALNVEPRLEMMVQIELRSRNYETFLPIEHKPATGADHRPLEGTLLFPGYVFCRVDLRDHWVSIVTTPGVIRLAGGGTTPVPLPEKQIRALSRMTEAAGDLRACGSPEQGKTVRVLNGPLADIEGVLCMSGQRPRLALEVSIIRQWACLELPGESAVAPISPGAGRTLHAFQSAGCTACRAELCSAAPK